MRLGMSGALSIGSGARVRARALAVIGGVLAAGCGGEGGIRPMQAKQPMDAGITKYMCDGTNMLNCSRPSMLMPDGHVTNFSTAEWTASSGKWCDASGFHGSTFSFPGNQPTDLNAITVDAVDESLRLSLTVSQGSYGGGGIAFESCLDATAFSGVQFTVAVSSGSMTGCTYQLQLQTLEQRPVTQNPPGLCDSSTGVSCYNFPAATNLPAPSTDPANPTLVMIPFSSFSASAMMPATVQLVGLQWQVNAAPAGCTVQLRIDDIDFIPAAAPPAASP